MLSMHQVNPDTCWPPWPCWGLRLSSCAAPVIPPGRAATVRERVLPGRAATRLRASLISAFGLRLYGVTGRRDKSSGRPVGSGNPQTACLSTQLKAFGCRARLGSEDTDHWLADGASVRPSRACEQAADFVLSRVSDALGTAYSCARLGRNPGNRLLTCAARSESSSTPGRAATVRERVLPGRAATRLRASLTTARQACRERVPRTKATAC